MTRSPRLGTRAAVRMYRAALRCSPPDFFARFGETSVVAFRDGLAAARRRGRWAACLYTASSLADAAGAGLRERRAATRVAARRIPGSPASRPALARRLVVDLARDVRLAGRTLRRRPGFAAVATLTLALGTGANTAIFSVVESVLLAPLPFREPARLVEVWESHLDHGWDRTSVAQANFWDFRALNRTFEDLGAHIPSSLNLTGLGEPQWLTAGRISAGFFRVLGVVPAAGRTFLDEESEPGRDNRVVLLGHRLWVERFGADPAIVGRSLTLDGASYEVVGVLPSGTPWLDAADVFVPLVHAANLSRGSFDLSVVGRLRPGVTMEAARDDLARVCRRLAADYPASDKGLGVMLRPSSRWVASAAVRAAVWTLAGAVGVLLLIACVNLTSLFLARASARTREYALRAALGASRGRLARQVLAESALVGLLGAALGLLLGAVVVEVVRAFGPGDIPRLADAGIDGRVLASTTAAALAAALLGGLVPALRARRTDSTGALREGERGVAGAPRAARLRAVLVGAEVALSLVLLVGAGLLVRSFAEVLAVDRGFDADRRLIAAMNVPASYDAARTRRLLVDFLSRVESTPGVVSAAAVSMRPLIGPSTSMGIASADAPEVAADAVPWATWRLVSSDYFTTIGLPVLRGRAFTDQDQFGNPWRVIVSRRVAEQLWPGADPVGRQAILWKGQANTPAEVVGVVGDMRERSLAVDPPMAVYLPYYGATWTPIQVVVHTAGAPLAILPVLRAALDEIDPNLPISNAQTLDGLVTVSTASRRFTMLLLAAFAAVALILALAGVYGVLAYTVSRRTAEIGVRKALGASPASLLRLVVWQGMQPVVAGAGAGLAGAVALSPVMASLLFGVAPEDPLTYVSVTALLLASATLACYLPARQALRVDPVAALKEE